MASAVTDSGSTNLSLKGGLSDLSAGFGLYSGIESGTALGDAKAAVSATKLASGLGTQSGLFSSSTGKALNSYAGLGANALGIYSGIEQGGVAGDSSAAINAAQLGSRLGAFGSASSTIGAVAGYAAIPLALYNFAENYQSGKTGSDTLQGAEAGAAIGSVIPVVGTAVGAIVGAAVGALSSAFGPGAKDPETANVQGLIDYTSSHGNSPTAAQHVSDPYVELAGLMDRRESTLPMYAQYGRMGEQRFTNDMVTKMNAALAQDPSLANNPQAMYSQVIAPWVAKMGTGYNNVGTTYSAVTQGLLQDMVTQYLSGNAANDWKSVGGQEPFSDIYKNSPIKGAPSDMPPMPTAQQTLLASRLSPGAGARILGSAPALAANSMAAQSLSPASAPMQRRTTQQIQATPAGATSAPSPSNISIPSGGGGSANAALGIAGGLMAGQMFAGGPGGDPTAIASNSGTGTNLTGINGTTGLAGVGGAISSGLTNLGVPSGISSALPYLAAGGLGLYQSGQAAKQNQGYVSAISNLGQPFTSAGQTLLSEGMNGQLSPANQNVVNTLNAQGKQLIDSAAPLAGIANTAFANYQAGQLNPGQQQQIDAWTASAKQELRQTLASSGISDSSILASQDAAIDSQATQLKANLMAQNLQVGDQQYAQWLTSTEAGQQLQAQGAQYAATSINTMLSQALQLGSFGAQQQTQAVQTAIQQDQQLSSNVGNLMKSLAGAYSLANAPSKLAGALGSAAGAAASLTPSQIRQSEFSQDPGTVTPLTNEQILNDPQFAVPSLDSITAGMSTPNFQTEGYGLNADNTVDTSTFDNYFFDPSSVDVPNIDFGGG